MGLLDWLSNGLMPAIVRDDVEDAQVFAIGLCPFTGCHWLVQVTSNDDRLPPAEASRR